MRLTEIFPMKRLRKWGPPISVSFHVLLTLTGLKFHLGGGACFCTREIKMRKCQRRRREGEWKKRRRKSPRWLEELTHILGFFLGKRNCLGKARSFVLRAVNVIFGLEWGKTPFLSPKAPFIRGKTAQAPKRSSVHAAPYLVPKLLMDNLKEEGKRVSTTIVPIVPSAQLPPELLPTHSSFQYDQSKRSVTTSAPGEMVHKERRSQLIPPCVPQPARSWPPK